MGKRWRTLVEHATDIASERVIASKRGPSRYVLFSPFFRKTLTEWLHRESVPIGGFWIDFINSQEPILVMTKHQQFLDRWIRAHPAWRSNILVSETWRRGSQEKL